MMLAIKIWAGLIGLNLLIILAIGIHYLWEQRQLRAAGLKPPELTPEPIPGDSVDTQFDEITRALGMGDDFRRYPIAPPSPRVVRRVPVDPEIIADETRAKRLMDGQGDE